MILFAFDRDLTIDVNQGPVPLSWVIQIAKRHKVYAIGNRALGPEAGIPNHVDIKRMVRERGVKVVERQPNWEGRLGVLIPEDQVYRNVERTRSNIEGKFRRMSYLDALHPEATRKIVVDDLPLHHMRGWEYWTPAGFKTMGLETWLTA